MEKFSKNYTPSDEREIYEKWEKGSYFSDKGGSETFSIMMPPPNVTGKLHLGHALEHSIMDATIRFERMRGKSAVIIPGTDHAAVATQARVEKDLIEGGMKNPREELGKEELVSRIRDYAEEQKKNILDQFKLLGTSCDWSFLAYTFDEKRSIAVNTVFKKMYDDGLIYRGHRIVNWDPKLQTTVSDDEIVRVEEKSTFYYFKYGPFTIGTSRPETKFGDKYVVMNPNDDRYKKYKHGDKIDVDWIGGKITATIIKDDAVEQDFGTGVMTISPWHDRVDFEIAERHNLEREQIIDWSGNMLSIAKEFEGLSIKDARSGVVEKLREKGLLIEEDGNYTHQIAVSERSGEIIEPQIKEQWFVAMTKKIPGRGVSFNDLQRKVFKSGYKGRVIKMYPERFLKVYYEWVNNPRDWCISRQIWWGHRIPVWYKGAEVYCGLSKPKGNGWVQDEDTLDTWFSSSLWSFSALDWPETLEVTKRFHPTSFMQMGYEIIFLWMARMIMMSTYVMDEIPFKDVYIHGLVRDSKSGKKFSKSLRNSIDPKEIIETYGADALRLALLSGVKPGNDIKFYIEKVQHYKHLTNKIWNVARFLSQFDDESTVKNSMWDKWILEKFDELTRSVTKKLEKYEYSSAVSDLYEFTWHVFADWYVEVVKNGDASSSVAKKLFRDLLKLWHPFMPFCTEKIWSIIEGDVLIIKNWPERKKSIFSFLKLNLKGSKNNDIDLLIDLIKEVRSVRDKFKLNNPKVVVDTEFYKTHKNSLEKFLVNVESGEKPKKSISIVVKGISVHIKVGDNFDTKKEKERLTVQYELLSERLKRFDDKLGNDNFLKHANQDVISETRKLRTVTSIEMEQITNLIDSLSGI